MDFFSVVAACVHPRKRGIKLVEYGSILVHLRFLAEANPTCSAKKLRSARITVVLQKLEIRIGSTRVLTPSPPETGGKTLSTFKMF